MLAPLQPAHTLTGRKAAVTEARPRKATPPEQGARSARAASAFLFWLQPPRDHSLKTNSSAFPHPEKTEKEKMKEKPKPARRAQLSPS